MKTEMIIYVFSETNSCAGLHRDGHADDGVEVAAPLRVVAGEKVQNDGNMTTNVDSLENGGGERRGSRDDGWGDRWGDWRGMLKRFGVKSDGGSGEYSSSAVDRGAGREDGILVHGGSGIGDQSKGVLVVGI